MTIQVTPQQAIIAFQAITQARGYDFFSFQGRADSFSSKKFRNAFSTAIVAGSSLTRQVMNSLNTEEEAKEIYRAANNSESEIREQFTRYGIGQAVSPLLRDESYEAEVLSEANHFPENNRDEFIMLMRSAWAAVGYENDRNLIEQYRNSLT